MTKNTLAILLTFLLAANFLFAQDVEMNADAAKLYNEGNQLVKSGQFQGALEKYNAATAIQKDYRIEYQKGIVLKKLRKFVDAEQAFKESINLKNDFGVAYNALGGTYYSNGKYQEAIDAFTKFQGFADKESHKKRADVNISRAFTKLGEAAKSDGNFQKAVEYLTKAVEHDTYDAAYLLLAETKIDLGDYAGALEAADKASNYRKNIPKGGPYYYKGLAFNSLGDKVKAKEAFEEGKKDPKYRSLCEYQLKHGI
ncbi:MAG: tetratricopeptide repeat protein [Melioribacteraceae bacterium]|nr:tetratricopeptide repeat protein [Melioribacteraceae bacterium]